MCRTVERIEDLPFDNENGFFRGIAANSQDIVKITGQASQPLFGARTWLDPV